MRFEHSVPGLAQHNYRLGIPPRRRPILELFLGGGNHNKRFSTTKADDPTRAKPLVVAMAVCMALVRVAWRFPAPKPVDPK